MSDDIWAPLRQQMFAEEDRRWTGDDDRPDDARAHALSQEEQREREWHEMEALARDFVKTYGAPAMLRCVSHALDKK